MKNVKASPAKPRAPRKPRIAKVEIVKVEETVMNDTLQIEAAPQLLLPAPAKIRKVTGVSRKAAKVLSEEVALALLNAFGEQSKLGRRPNAIDALTEEWATFAGTFSAYVATLIVRELDGLRFEHDKARVAAEQALKTAAHVAEDLRRDRAMGVLG